MNNVVRFVGAVMVGALVVSPAWAGPLAARQELVKTPDLVRPDHPHRLVVKFRDRARVRARNGGVVSLGGADLAAVRDVAVRHDAEFEPLFRISEERLSRIEMRAAAASLVAQPDFAGITVVTAPADSREAACPITHRPVRATESMMVSVSIGAIDRRSISSGCTPCSSVRSSAASSRGRIIAP